MNKTTRNEIVKTLQQAKRPALAKAFAKDTRPVSAAPKEKFELALEMIELAATDTKPLHDLVDKVEAAGKKAKTQLAGMNRMAGGRGDMEAPVLVKTFLLPALEGLAEVINDTVDRIKKTCI